MKKAFATFGLIAAVMLAGCGGETSSTPSEIIVTGGNTSEAEQGIYPVKLPDGTEIKSEPERIASLSPAATEILAELGYSDRLCAVSRYCDYPDGLPEVTAGSSENPDIDKLTELSPDVVFTMSALAEREIYTLDSAGITVVTLSAPKTLEDFGKLYGTAAEVFSGSVAGDSAAEKAVSELKNSASGVELGTFIYVTPKLTAAGSDTFESAVLSLCGRNLCAGAGYAELSEETEAPQYIIAADSLTEAEISGNAVYAGMISSGAEVLFVPAGRFERPSARLSEVFSALSEQLSGSETAE